MKYQCRFPNVSIEKRVEKVLLKIPQSKLREDIMQAVEKLSVNPRPFGSKPFKQLKPPLPYFLWTAQYRIRVGDYRILYDVDDDKKIVWILALKKRNGRIGVRPQV